jgi:hypothetical protein
MRLFLRRAGLALAAGWLIFCCSCERHRSGELPELENAKGHTATEATNEHASATPVLHNSPANFFPDKPKP